MKNLMALAFVAVGLVGVSTSQAMTPAPLDTPSDIVMQVAGGCGAGWHRGPYGGCRKNYANPRAHACPRGYHVGPGGGCRANGR
jgi:hypothetical protein